MLSRNSSNQESQRSSKTSLKQFYQANSHAMLCVHHFMVCYKFITVFIFILSSILWYHQFYAIITEQNYQTIHVNRQVCLFILMPDCGIPIASIDRLVSSYDLLIFDQLQYLSMTQTALCIFISKNAQWQRLFCTQFY